MSKVFLKQRYYRLTSFLIFCSFALLAFNGNAKKQNNVEQGEVYFSLDDEMKSIDDLIDKAYNNNKLAMIVLGANWCEDSVSLATKFASDEVKGIISSHYELIFINVGYFTNVKPVINRFGRPVIYATPTVLVIDPSTDEIINADSMSLWYQADKISNMEVVHYFKNLASNPRQEMAKLSSINGQRLARLNKLLGKISNFENKNAVRIYQGFSKIGPLIEKNLAGNKSVEFEKIWNEFATYRYTLSRDLGALKTQAIEMVQTKYPNKKLLFPEYPPFSWNESIVK